MISEGFRDFFKNRQPSPTSKPKSVTPKKTTQDIHDDSTDQAMHHLHSLHRLTHPDSEWSKANKGKSRSLKRISELHNDVNELIKKHGERSDKTF